MALDSMFYRLIYAADYSRRLLIPLYEVVSGHQGSKRHGSGHETGQRVMHELFDRYDSHKIQQMTAPHLLYTQPRKK